MRVKVIWLIAMICASLISTQKINAQTVVVQNNSGTATTSSEENTNIEYINGIPSTQDIGGVEAWKEYDSDTRSFFAMLKNYNPFTVTVNYKIITELLRGEDSSTQVGSVVIPSGQTKSVRLRYSQLVEVHTITRKL